MRARLTGHGALAATLHGADHLAHLLALLRDTAPPQVHWAELVNETRSSIDIASRRGRDDLEGAIVEAADALQGEAGGVLAGITGSGRPARALFESISEAERDALLARALERALQQLSSATESA